MLVQEFLDHFTRNIQTWILRQRAPLTSPKDFLFDILRLGRLVQNGLDYKDLSAIIRELLVDFGIESS